jgi:hypothetical protein
VDGVPSALLVTRDIMRKGADHVKICVSPRPLARTIERMDDINASSEENRLQEA